MELFKENLMGNQQPAGGAFNPGMLVFLMSGAAPTTPAEVKAAFDVYDIQDLYAKCVGVTQVLQSKGIAEAATFQLAPNGAVRTAFKKGDFDHGVGAPTNALIPVDMRKASIPDRFFFCSKDAPFTRLAAKTGMAGANMLRDLPFQFYESGVYGAVAAGNGNHPDSLATYVTELEWDTARNFGGILRSSTAKLGASNGYTVTVEAWNGSAWEVVLAATAKAGAVAANYVAFTKKISTTKLRIQTTVTGTWSIPTCFYPHGIIPLEVIADAPAPAAVPTIGWVVMVPMSGYVQVFNTVATMAPTFNDVTGPIPFYVAKAGIAGDAGAEFIMTKVAGLLNNERPSLAAATKFIAANIKE